MSGRRRLLIVHDDGAVRLTLMRAFEEAGWGTQGVRTSLGAETWLTEGNPVDLILLSWDLPEQGAARLLLSQNCRALDDRPGILAYASKWTLDDLRRAIQLGSDGILRTPLTLESVTADLDALVSTGETRSRRLLLDQAAESLLQPVEFLVDEDADRAEQNRVWVEGMRSMAGTLRDFLRRIRGLETEDEPVDVTWLRTLVDSMRQAEANVDMARLRALIQSDAWNDQIDEVTRRRLMAMFNRRTEAELRVDLERLRALFGPELTSGAGLDVDRMRALLDRPQALEAFDSTTRERLRLLRGRDWRTVLDYVKLEELKARFGRRADEAQVDRERMRGLLSRGDDAEELGLSAEEQMRLQLTMAMMFRVRNDEDRGKLVDRLRGAHGKDGKTAIKLKVMLREMSEERTIQMLRAKMGVSPHGATPMDVMNLLSRNDLDSSIFGVAEVPDEHPDSVPLLNEIGMRLKRAQRWGEAAEHYERALDIMPGEPGLLFNYARMKFDLGDVDAAVALVDRMDAESQTQVAVRTLRMAIERHRRDHPTPKGNGPG